MGQEAPSSPAPAAPCASRNISREGPGPWAGAAALGLEVEQGPGHRKGTMLQRERDEATEPQPSSAKLTLAKLLRNRRLLSEIGGSYSTLPVVG